MRRQSLRKLSYTLFGFIGFVVAYNTTGSPWSVRFEETYLNYWAFGFLCFAFPTTMFAAAICTKGIGLKTAGVVLAAVLVVPASFIGYIAVFEAKDIRSRGVDLSLLLLDELNIAGSVYRLYRTDCGATCSYGLMLREERHIVGGLKVVTVKWSVTGQSDATLHLHKNSVLVKSNSQVMAQVKM